MRELGRKAIGAALSAKTALLFLVLPAAMLVLVLLERIPFEPLYLLVNNILFMLYLVLRLVRYALRARAGARYGASGGPEGRLVGSVGQEKAPMLADALGAAGYRAQSSRGYFEAREAGYWGGVLMHLALVCMILVGSYDYATQFSGEYLLGRGSPLPLSAARTNPRATFGYFFSDHELDYKIQILDQKRPAPDLMSGAGLLSLQDARGNELARQWLTKGQRMEYGDLIIGYNAFVYDIWVVILQNDTQILLTDWARLAHVEGSTGGYFLSGTVYNELTHVKAEVWLDPATEDVVVLATRDGEVIADRVKISSSLTRLSATEGDVSVTVEGIGRWSDFQVRKKRHIAELKAAAIAALLGLMLRLFVRPRRVWVVKRDGALDVYATRADEVRGILNGAKD